jgi:hypothetical protein
VRIVLPVAIDAGRAEFLVVGIALVAGLAGDGRVLAGKWVLGIRIVVEIEHLPAFDPMAGIALASKVAVMAVVAFMAAKALAGSLVRRNSFLVAGVASHLRVPATQWVSGIGVMIESSVGPCHSVMAARTFGPISPLVLIVRPVAADAIGSEFVVVESPGMAGITGHLMMPALKRELRIPVVIEADVLPALFVMAFVA